MLGELWWQEWRRWRRRRWKEQGTSLQPLAWWRRINWPNRCVYLQSFPGEEVSNEGLMDWGADGVFSVCQLYECRMICVMPNKWTAKNMSAVSSLYFEWFAGSGNLSRVRHGTSLLWNFLVHLDHALKCDLVVILNSEASSGGQLL